MTRLVYFARRVDGEGPIKIGCSIDVESRLYQLGVDYRTSFTVLATAPGDFLAERNVHLKFAAHRVDLGVDKPGATEWFAPAPKLLAFVEKVKRIGALPLSKADCRERIFAERYLAGETLQQIADDYGLTRERVRQVLRRIGVESLGLRDEHKAKAHDLTFAERLAAKLYSQGLQPKEIIEKTRLTYTQIRTAVLRTGGQIKPQGHWLLKPNDSEITETVCRLYREGKRIHEIVEAVPDLRYPETVYRYLKKGGVTPERATTVRGELEQKADAIIAAYRGGGTYAEVAERFGASIPGVTNLIKRHGAALSPEESEQRRRERVSQANRRRARLAA